MTVGRAFTIIAVAAFVCAFLGGFVGGLLALVAPGYYTSVFSGPVEPMPTGLGLGISQGLIVGSLLGIGVVALLTWREVRLREIEARRSADYPRPQV